MCTKLMKVKQSFHAALHMLIPLPARPTPTTSPICTPSPRRLHTWRRRRNQLEAANIVGSARA